MKPDRNMIWRLLQNRVLQHTLFWCFSFYYLLYLFSPGSPQKIDWIYTGVFHVPLLAGVYFIIVKADKKLHKVNFEDITYLNSIGDYLKIFMKNGKVIITNETMKSIEESLPSNLFLRIHKSYIVSVRSILYIEGNQLVIEGADLPIGLKYKEQLIARFGSRH